MTSLNQVPKPTFGIFLLCHDRPEETRQAIRSILAQSDSDFSLTVSDNSSNDAVEAMVQKEFPAVRYVRRVPELLGIEHFNRCIEEAATDYFCLFHDDDLMGQNFMREAKLAALQFPHAVAIGCNAEIDVFGKLQPKPSFLALDKYERISSAIDLAARYFSRSQSGIAPFPGYVYKKSLVGNQRLFTDGGKYTDVTWLLELARRAEIVWIRLPLMTYRMHGGNDGNIESRADRFRFLGYLKRSRQWLGNEIIEDYRCSFVYKPILKGADNRKIIKRVGVARQFVSCYRLTRYIRASTYIALVTRALVKMAKQS